MAVPTDSNLAERGALTVSGMNCASCVSHVEQAIRKLPGVDEVSVNLARGRASLRFDPRQVDLERVAAAVSDAGYPSAPETDQAPASQARQEAHHADLHAAAWKRRAIIGVILWLPVEALHWLTVWFGPSHGHADGASWMTWLAFATSTAALILVGGGFYRSAWAALRHGTTNMDTLISMGATVAYVYSFVAFFGSLLGWWGPPEHLYFTEGTALLALISLGHYLEGRARDRAGVAIRELLELAPETALRLPGGGPKKRLLSLGVIQPPDAHTFPAAEEVPVSVLVVGDRVLVKPGMRVPIDGEVIGGVSSVDESMFTGEPLPVKRQSGDPVLGGSVNRDGALTVRVTRVGAETALAQIVRLVEEAQNAKPAVQRLADRISAVFVPVVIGLAALVGVAWFIYGTTKGWDARQTWGTIANTVCSVLIIACPCALGIALPAALMVGTGWGARHGILIRSLEALQRGERVRRVVLDKTGTITEGRPRVVEVTPVDGVFERELLYLAGSAELHSEHPLGKAIVDHARSLGIELHEPADFRNEPGSGVHATVGTKAVFVGQDGDQGGVGVQLVDESGGRRSLGTITLRDTTRADSRQAIADLRRLGVDVVMLTGDRESTARAIAGEVGIGHVIAGVRPDGKARAIEELKAGLKPGEAIIMIGDGVNDAPALAAADLGIAIGSGSDIAKQSSAIVLVGSSLAGAVDAIRLARVTMRTIRQNLFWAFFYNVAMIPLAALGYLSPAKAAAAMALSDLTVIGNALRIRRQMRHEEATVPRPANEETKNVDAPGVVST